MDSMNKPANILLVLVFLTAVAAILYNQTTKQSSYQIEEKKDSLINNSNQATTDQTEDNMKKNTNVKGAKQYSKFPGELKEEEIKGKKAVVKTNKGEIVFEFYSDSPKAASNFIFLAKDGYYDGLTFHRVVPEFVIQGGDPTGTGSGGPGYRFEDEPVMRKYTKGTVAMANAGPDTNGSQFFIMLEDNEQLPPSYTIFGQVISGQDVVDKIVVGDVMEKVTVE